MTQPPPYPEGWYTVAFSRELKPGQLLKRKLAGRDLIVYRTESGRAVVQDAHCPHLGAHIGFGGEVVGESVRCPFHHFRFDPEGVCVATGYDTKPPPTARLNTWKTREHSGIIMTWFGEEDRLFDIPELETQGWSPLQPKTFFLNTHVQDLAENSVDLGHLTIVHKFPSAEPLTPLEVHGPHLTASYAILHPMLPGIGGPSIRAHFTAKVYGLGYSLVEVFMPRFGAHARVFANASPVDEDTVAMRLSFSLKNIVDRDALPRPLRWLPIEAITDLLSRIASPIYALDVKQDFDIWNNKRYIERPPLAKGDGPIPAYRKWARQFYPEYRDSPDKRPRLVS